MRPRGSCSEKSLDLNDLEGPRAYSLLSNKCYNFMIVLFNGWKFLNTPMTNDLHH